MAHPQWTGLLGTELERAEREDMWVEITNILWAKELLKSNNLGGEGDVHYVILKGTKLHPEEN